MKPREKSIGVDADIRFDTLNIMRFGISRKERRLVYEEKQSSCTGRRAPAKTVKAAHPGKLAALPDAFGSGCLNPGL